MAKKLIVLGIDPGTIVTGYGVVVLHDNQLTAADFGCIKPKTKILALRYRYIFEGLCELCDKYKPDALSIEDQYVSKNVRSALKLGMAKGTCIVAASLREIPVFEYAPTTAKRAIAGRGNASKERVQFMIQHLLKLPHLPQPEDASDALALAICHIHRVRHV